MSEKIITILRSGVEYRFDPDSDAKPEVEYEKDYFDDRRRLIYEYSLNGAHDGPPILIKMIDPGEECDEDGWRGVWDGLAYADNDEQIDDVVDDFYHDALREDLEITIKETWH